MTIDLTRWGRRASRQGGSHQSAKESRDRFRALATGGWGVTTKETTYGAQVRTDRPQGRTVSTMLRHRLCAPYRRPARIEVDCERLCRSCVREVLA